MNRLLVFLGIMSLSSAIIIEIVYPSYFLTGLADSLLPGAGALVPVASLTFTSLMRQTYQLHRLDQHFLQEHLHPEELVSHT